MESLIRLDRRAYLLCQRRLRRPWFSPFMVHLTNSGTKGVIWLLVAVVMLGSGTHRTQVVAGICVLALISAEGMINLILKPVASRPRPYARYGSRLLLVKAPGASSWPSAHAGSSLAAALVLAYAFPAWGGIPLVCALLIGYSRVYVGVHYPLDVLAGFAVGGVTAIGILGIAVGGLGLI